MFKLSVKTKLRVDTRQWKQMSRRLTHGSGKTVQTGFFGTIHPSGFQVAQIAAWNEEGHINGGMFSGTITPARPFIRRGFMPAAQKMIRNSYRDIHRIAMGQLTWNSYYNELGRNFVVLMQKSIAGWSNPPNTPITVSLKGFNNPLVETGAMMASVKYKIVQKRSTA